MNKSLFTTMQKERNLTEGSIVKTMLLFSIPMILGNFLQQVYNIADTMIVGHFLGAEALAAVGSSYSLMTFLMSVILGLCMGSSALFSIAYGAGDEKTLKESMWASFWLILVVSVALFAVSFGFTDSILRILQIPQEVYPMMYTYVRIVLLGIPFIFIYNYFGCLVRAVGDSVTPLIFLGVASVLNIVLDLLFVAVLGLGVAGAAEATVIAQAACGVGIGAHTLGQRKHLRVSKEYRHIRGPVLRQVASYSFLTCAQQSVMNFGILMIQGLVNSFGTVIMAAFAVAVKIDTLAYMPAQEFGNGFSLFISQNYGARKEERIRRGVKQAYSISIVFCAMISLLVWVLAAPLMKVFLDVPNPEIVQAGVTYLHIEGACYIGIGCLFLFYGLYRGLGKPGMSFLLTVVSLGTRVALAYALAPNPSFGVTAIWWAIPIGWGLADLIGLLYYLRTKKFVMRK